MTNKLFLKDNIRFGSGYRNYMDTPHNNYHRVHLKVLGACRTTNGLK